MKKMRLLSRNREVLILFLITLAARVFLVLTARGVATDGCAYGWLAMEFAEGNFREVFNSAYPPLLPIFTVGASYIFRDFELSARMVSCLFGSLTVFPLFFLIKDIFDKKTALMTVLFFIVHPYLSQASGEVLTEALYFFFVTSIAFLSWIAIQKSKHTLFLLVGLLLCLASLTRPEGVALTFLVLGWIWLKGTNRLKNALRWKLISSLFCLSVFIVVLLPCLFYIHQETGVWQINIRQQAAINLIRQEGMIGVINRFYRHTPKMLYFLSKAYYPVFLIFLFFGVIKRKMFKGFRIGEAYILSFILLGILIVMAFTGVTDRYFYSFIPMALCWAAAGFWEIDYRLQQKFKDKSLSVGKGGISRFSIIILVIVMAVCLPKGLRPIRGHRAIQKKVGYWLKENAGQKEFIVMASSPQESFHAGAKWYKLKGKTYAEVISNAREKRADFIIINKKADKICPDFRDSVKADDLEVFTNKFENSDKKIVIYKLKK